MGSKVEIYRLIHKLAAQGKGILFVSSYLPELLGVCDRLAVMHRGRLGPAKKVEDWNEQEIMKAATFWKIADKVSVYSCHCEEWPANSGTVTTRQPQFKYAVNHNQ